MLNVTTLESQTVSGVPMPVFANVITTSGVITINGASVLVTAGETAATVIGNMNAVLGGVNVDPAWSADTLTLTNNTGSNIVLGGNADIWAELGFAASGYVLLRATIVNGLTPSVNFVRDFRIAVSPADTTISLTTEISSAATAVLSAVGNTAVLPHTEGSAVWAEQSSGRFLWVYSIWVCLSWE